MKITLYIILMLYVCCFSPSALSSGGGGGGGGGGGASNYKELNPPFLVNLPDPNRASIMQISIAVEVHDDVVRKAIDEHAPLIRNNLLMLFAAQTREVVRSREGREKLRADAEEVVNKALKEVKVAPINGLYFTGLVVQ